MDSTDNTKIGKENKASSKVTTRSKSVIKTISFRIPPDIKWLEHLPDTFVSFTNYNPAHQLKEMLSKINSEDSLDDNYLVVNGKEAFVKYGAA